jgi:hypothetical protein
LSLQFISLSFHPFPKILGIDFPDFDSGISFNDNGSTKSKITHLNSGKDHQDCGIETTSGQVFHG